MLRLSFKNLRAHKRRLVGTSFSVIIGIAFLAGTLVFTDTLNKVFDDLFADAYETTDAIVRSSNEIDTGFGGTQRPRMDVDVVDRVAALPGVTEAIGDITGFARIVGADGDPLGQDGGAPTFGASIVESDLLPWVIAEGAYPVGPDQVVVDQASADAGDLVVGGPVQINSQGGSREFTLVGVARFGEVDSPAGATFALFDLETAAEFVGAPGQVDMVLVGGDGSQQELAEAVRTGLADPELQVLTGTEISEEQASDVQRGLSFFNILLLTFAGIALFVSIFIIYNTFSIIVTQRQRETALLRAIGASRRQVVGALLIEAVMIGVVASLLGLLAGIGISSLLKAGLSALNIDLPDGPLVIMGRTVIASLVVGLIVTVVASVFPALAASRVPPIAAIRSLAVEDVRFSRKRLVFGALCAGVGVVVVAMGVSGTPALLGLGIPLVLVGILVLGPLLARPFARVIGAPVVQAKGMTGTLARENAMRNPKRTARTAAALMIGVALVAGIAVLGASIKSSIREIIGRQFTGDYVVATSTFGFGGLSPELATELDALPEVEVAAGVQIGFAEMDGDTEFLSVVDPTRAERVFDFEVLQGAFADIGDDGIAVSRQRSERDALTMGSTVDLALQDGVPRTLTVRAIYEKDDLAGPYTVSQGFYALGGADQYDFSVYVLLAEGIDDEMARPALETVTDRYPSGELQGRTEYIDTQAASIDPLINIIYGLLFLAVFIAVVGIANTLSLSIHERIRELGLIRAVGGTRRQVRGMVRWESIITALLGTVQGVIVGIALGYALILALRDEGLSTFTLPVGTLVALVVLAMVCGFLAALLPAWRASRLNVLEAIANE